MVGFRVKIPILGDITLGLWFGDHRAEHDPPAFAYAVNTAFLQVQSFAAAVAAMRGDCAVPTAVPAKPGISSALFHAHPSPTWRSRSTFACCCFTCFRRYGLFRMQPRHA